MERSCCYINSIDRFSKELSTNFVETLRNYNENHFDYKRNDRCYDGASQWYSTLEDDRSDDSSFDCNGDPKESQKLRRTVNDNVIYEGKVDSYLNIIILNKALN